MGAACDLLTQLTPDLHTDPSVEGRSDASALCAALQSAEVNLFADGVAQGTQKLAAAVAHLDKASGRTRLVFQVAAAALESRRSPPRPRPRGAVRKAAGRSPVERYPWRALNRGFCLLMM